MVSVEEISNEQCTIQTVDKCVSVIILLPKMNFSHIESQLHQHLGYALGRRWDTPLWYYSNF